MMDDCPTNGALTSEETEALKKLFATHCSPLLKLLPICRNGIEYKPPAYACIECDLALGYEHWMGVINNAPQQPGGIALVVSTTCPQCGAYSVYRTNFNKSAAAVPIPLLHWLDLVALSRRLSATRGETDADRAQPITRRLWARLKKPFLWPMPAVIGAVLWVSNMPHVWALWSWTEAWETLNAVCPLVYGLWAAYEIGVLWASQMPAPDSRT